MKIAAGIMKMKTIAASTPCPMIRTWYCGKSRKRFPMPLYCIVAKLRPWRFGKRKEFRSVSQVPSPTNMVSLEYDAVPGGENALFDIANSSGWVSRIISAHVQLGR
jgi:hypothetical protein